MAKLPYSAFEFFQIPIRRSVNSPCYTSSLTRRDARVSANFYVITRLIRNYPNLPRRFLSILKFLQCVCSAFDAYQKPIHAN